MVTLHLEGTADRVLPGRLTHPIIETTALLFPRIFSIPVVFSWVSCVYNKRLLLTFLVVHPLSFCDSFFLSLLGKTMGSLAGCTLLSLCSSSWGKIWKPASVTKGGGSGQRSLERFTFFFFLFFSYTLSSPENTQKCDGLEMPLFFALLPLHCLLELVDVS